MILAGCASASGDYPSLGVRDAERRTGVMAPAEPEPVAQLSPEAAESVAALVARARAANADYLAKLPAARSAVRAASGAALGSEGWAVASVAIAALETERSRTMIALADLDRLYVAVAIEGGAMELLAAAQSEVAALAEAQTAGIDDLLRSLR